MKWRLRLVSSADGRSANVAAAENADGMILDLTGIVDHGDLLRRVGEMAFPHRTGRGDGANFGGGPDPRDVRLKPAVRDSYWPPHADGMDPEQAVRLKTRDFR